jgi:hypothetical protein
MGVGDMNEYSNWGSEANKIGLAVSYKGTYFPIQYQIFQICSALVNITNIDFVVIFKFVNLIFDFGVFFILIKILRYWNINPAYSLLYWFHPWFLSIFALGYIDNHFTFFVLLATLLAEKANNLPKYILASVPLGFAFLMKPQAQVLILILFFYIIFRFILKKEWQSIGLMAGSVILFITYSFFFMLKGRPIFHLLNSYINIKNVCPSLTAFMLNIWYPIAYFLRDPSKPISTVGQNIRIIGEISFLRIALIITIILIAIYAFLLSRKSQNKNKFDSSFTQLFAFSSLILPMVMTSAHENHLFLASVFFIPLIGHSKKSIYKHALHLLLILQFLNIVGMYGLGENNLSENIGFIKLAMWYWNNFPILVLIGSFIAIGSFLVVLYFMFLEAIKNDQKIINC